MTGSGKTTFTKELIHQLRAAYPTARTYILDSKQAGDFSDFAGVIRSREAPDALATAGAIQVWQPELDNVGEYDVWLQRIYRARQPAIVVIDELSSLSTSGRSYPEGYALLMKQGRGLDISVITATQEAAYIPRQTLGQTTHLIRFRLLDAYDARNVDAKLLRPRSEWGTNPASRYGFYYRRLDDEPRPPYLYSTFKHFFGIGQ